MSFRQEDNPKLDLNCKPLNLNTMQTEQRNQREIKMFIYLLESLAKDPSVKVRTEVATNILTPANTLKKLAKDPSFNVRRVVQKNIHCEGLSLAV